MNRAVYSSSSGIIDQKWIIIPLLSTRLGAFRVICKSVSLYAQSSSNENKETLKEQESS